MRLSTIRIAIAGLAAVAVAFALPAGAQTPTPPPMYNTPAGGLALTDPTSLIGLDSVTGLKCFVGSSATCLLPTAPPASEPLPSNAAKESGGNLDSITANTAQLHTDNGVAGSGITPPAGGSGLIGWVSGIFKAITATGTSSQVVQGAGTAGSPVGGVHSVQGVSGGVAVPTSLAAPATAGATVAFRQTATASAVALATNTLTNGMICKALSTNTGTISLGGSSVTTSNGYPLAAGEGASIGGNNSNLTDMIGTVITDVLACVGN